LHTSPNARHGIGGRALGSLVIIQVEVEVVVIARGGGGVVDRERIAPLQRLVSEQLLAEVLVDRAQDLTKRYL
jgi:hypothetical protein